MLAINHISYVDFLMAGYGARSVEAADPVHGQEGDLRPPGHRADHARLPPHQRRPGRTARRRTTRRCDYLRDGEVVGVFPEATISRSFLIKELKTGAVRMAAEADVPLVPTILWGTQRLFTKDHPQGLLAAQDDHGHDRRAARPAGRDRAREDPGAARGDVGDARQGDQRSTPPTSSRPGPGGCRRPTAAPRRRPRRPRSSTTRSSSAAPRSAAPSPRPPAPRRSDRRPRRVDRRPPTPLPLSDSPHLPLSDSPASPPRLPREASLPFARSVTPVRAKGRPCSREASPRCVRGVNSCAGMGAGDRFVSDTTDASREAKRPFARNYAPLRREWPGGGGRCGSQSLVGLACLGNSEMWARWTGADPGPRGRSPRRRASGGCCGGRTWPA